MIGLPVLCSGASQHCCDADLDSSWIHLQSLFEALDGVFKVFNAKAIGDAGLMTATFGIYIESCSRSQHYRGIVIVEVGEQPLTELVAVVDRKIDNGVECAFGHGAEATGNLVDAFDNDITTGNILVVDSIEILLWGIDGCFAEELTERRGRQASLGQSHSYGIDLTVAGYHATHACTACTIAFRDGIEKDDVAFQSFELHDAEMFVTIVAEFAVYLVGKKEEVVFLHQSCHLQ